MTGEECQKTSTPKKPNQVKWSVWNDTQHKVFNLSSAERSRLVIFSKRKSQSIIHRFNNNNNI